MIIKFGEDVPGYEIPVLNEREIRAAAGILFVLMFVSILMAAMIQDFTLLKYAIVYFLIDILIRVFISPRFAPTLIMGRMIVRNQVPEYVGAQQKKFAWYIGIVLAATMFVLVTIMNTYSPISGLICFICLIFLFFESAFGICIGCKVYKIIYRENAKYCPGEVCEVNARQPIQKTSWSQLFIVLTFIAFIVLSVFLFQEYFVLPPHDLFNGAPLPTK